MHHTQLLTRPKIHGAGMSNKEQTVDKMLRLVSGRSRCLILKPRESSPRNQSIPRALSMGGSSKSTLRFWLDSLSLGTDLGTSFEFDINLVRLKLPRARTSTISRARWTADCSSFSEGRASSAYKFPSIAAMTLGLNSSALSSATRRRVELQNKGKMLPQRYVLAWRKRQVGLHSYLSTLETSMNPVSPSWTQIWWNIPSMSAAIPIVPWRKCRRTLAKLLVMSGPLNRFLLSEVPSCSAYFPMMKTINA